LQQLCVARSPGCRLCAACRGAGRSTGVARRTPDQAPDRDRRTEGDSLTMKAVFGVAALLVATALSAFFDAKGFVYAAQAWRGGSMSIVVALYSLAYFVGGVTLYIL